MSSNVLILPGRSTPDRIYTLEYHRALPDPVRLAVEQWLFANKMENAESINFTQGTWMERVVHGVTKDVGHRARTCGLSLLRTFPIVEWRPPSPT